MLDFSWSEFLVVLIVAVLAVGPKQLPGLLYGLGRIVRRLQYMRFAVSRQFDEFMEETELQDINRVGRSGPRVIFDEALADEDVIEAEAKKDLEGPAS